MNSRKLSNFNEKILRLLTKEGNTFELSVECVASLVASNSLIWKNETLVIDIKLESVIKVEFWSVDTWTNLRFRILRIAANEGNK